ncbi:MAG: hypothetical protein RSC41_02840 [Oscillospiraceae bacterium]
MFVKKNKELILSMLLFAVVFALSCYIAFFDIPFLKGDGAVPIYSSTNRDIKIIDYSSNQVQTVYLNIKNSPHKNNFNELSLHKTENSANPVIVKNFSGEVLPTNPVETKLFYNKLFDIRGKSVIDGSDGDYNTIISAEYVFLDGESKSIEILVHAETKDYILKTLWNGICYEVDKEQAEKFIEIDSVVKSPKDVFYTGKNEVMSLNIFSNSFDYPIEITKSARDDLYNGDMGDNPFVLHKKDVELLVGKYFKGMTKVASMSVNQKLLEEYGFNSPEAILDVKTDTENTSIYFARPQGAVNYYVMVDKVPIIYETTLGRLPNETDINNYSYYFESDEDLLSVIYKSKNIQYIFDITEEDGRKIYKYNSREVPSQIFFDLYDKFAYIDVLQYVSIEENYQLKDMKLAFKITMQDKNKKEIFANFYTLDDKTALMYVGENDGFIVKNEFVNEILEQIEGLNN